MNSETENKVLELRQKGWSCEEIALKLHLKKEDIEKCYNQKIKEKDRSDEEEREREAEERREKEHNEELNQKLEEELFAPVKKIVRI